MNLHNRLVTGNTWNRFLDLAAADREVQLKVFYQSPTNSYKANESQTQGQSKHSQTILTGHKQIHDLKKTPKKKKQPKTQGSQRKGRNEAQQTRARK